MRVHVKFMSSSGSSQCKVCAEVWVHAHVKDRVSVGFMFALFSFFSTAEIIPRVWTWVRVRVEDRVRLRVRLRVAFRVSLKEADSGLCCLVGPCLLEVIFYVEDHCCAPFTGIFRFIAVLCFNPYTAICFLRDKFYFGFCVVISASLTLTLAK